MSANIREEIKALNLPIQYRLPMYFILEKRYCGLAIQKALKWEKPSYFKTGTPILTEEGGKTGFARVDYMWIVMVSGWWAEGMVILSGTKYIEYLGQPNVLHEVLLLPKEPNNFEEFLGVNPFRSFEVPGSIDQVANALLELNLFEAENKVTPGNIIAPTINIIIFNGNGDRTINYIGDPLEDRSWINLFETVNHEIERLRHLYADPQMEAFFSEGLRWGGSE